VSPHTPPKKKKKNVDKYTSNTHELQQITLQTAAYYAFIAPPPPTPPLLLPPPTQVMLGPAEALDALQLLGATLATSAWVENHWRLILWKLVGMICIAPDRELDDDKRWSWDEVMRQLRYRCALPLPYSCSSSAHTETYARYERELLGGIRPPMRLITTQDVSSALPMVLCVSNVLWPEPGIENNGVAELAQPELELTDGWYRLRAKIDAPLARAARKGMLGIGQKIEVVGASVRPVPLRAKSPEDAHANGSIACGSV
jgi:breast cancer 2 susceptibility protein